MLQTFCHLGYILLKENISELNLLPEKKNLTLKQVVKNFTSLSPGRSSQDIVDAEASVESDLVTSSFAALLFARRFSACFLFSAILLSRTPFNFKNISLISQYCSVSRTKKKKKKKKKGLKRHSQEIKTFFN
jgi:hypothetical protein